VQPKHFAGIRPTTLAAAMACAAALALSACGGSGDSTSSATTAGGGQGEGTTTAAPEPSSKQGGSGNSGSKADSGPSGGSGSTAGGPRVTALKVSGGGSTQFRVKGGDNSVQEFGEEGDEAQLREVAEVVHGFYADRATGDWRGACAVLSATLLKQLEKLAAQSSEGRGTDCPTFLAAFTGEVSPAEWRQITTVDAGSLRYEGEQAFLIYYGPEHTVYAMPMAQEGGEWKVGALSSAQLPGT